MGAVLSRIRVFLIVQCEFLRRYSAARRMERSDNGWAEHGVGIARTLRAGRVILMVLSSRRRQELRGCHRIGAVGRTSGRARSAVDLFVHTAAGDLLHNSSGVAHTAGFNKGCRLHSRHVRHAATGQSDIHGKNNQNQCAEPSSHGQAIAEGNTHFHYIDITPS